MWLYKAEKHRLAGRRERRKVRAAPTGAADSLARRRYAPATVISPIRSDGTLTLPPRGTQRVLVPTAVTAFSIDTRSEAIVTSLTGSASSPPAISRPVAPTEKVPEIGLTPECRPLTDIT